MILFIVAGIALMLGAILSDPWGDKPSAAVTYLIGASLLIIGVFS